MKSALRKRSDESDIVVLLQFLEYKQEFRNYTLSETEALVHHTDFVQ
jgi:hypothetical protein